MPSRPPRPGAPRPGTPASDSIRPGLAIAAALAIATALGAVGFSLHAVLGGDGDDEPAGSTRRAVVARAQPAPQAEREQPFARFSAGGGRPGTSVLDDPASAGRAAARGGADVPEWDGQGRPSRAWVEHWITQWFEQYRPEAKPAPRELMRVVDLAIELDETRLEIQEVNASSGDADLLARLEERARLVQEELLSITEIGGAEIPRF